MAKRPRVLIAEDHPGVAKAVWRVLALDCDVVGTVADGSAVLEAAQRLQPDVIVVDFNLPNVNGLPWTTSAAWSSDTSRIGHSALGRVDFASTLIRSGIGNSAVA